RRGGAPRFPPVLRPHRSRRATMNIFVKNLPPTAEEADLRAAFATYGAVRASAVVRDKLTGASRGCGYVEMRDEAEGAEAVARLHGRDVAGYALSVRPSTANPASVERAYRRAAMTR